jgi:hypothetical protein
MASWEEFSRIVTEAKASKKLDPVGQEDDDVDNDGDSDSSDSYLKKRRSAVGAAIAADKKKKVEEALDPVGQEDKDIDNDGDHDKSDKYLLNRRKVRAKVIPPQEKLKTDRDMFNIPKSEQEAARERLLAKTKAKREKMKEETEQLDEIAPLAIGAGVAAAAAAPYLMKKFAKPAVDKAINKPATGSGGLVDKMKQRRDATNSAIQQLRQSFEQEGEMVEEDKEYRREMRKAAARERAEEKRERKGEGKKSAKAPGRLGKSAGTSYADKEHLSIKGHDEVTKKSGHTVGNPFPENYVTTGEYIEEMPYQVYGSPDGKTEKKIGKPVKSKKYAHGRAEELADTHKGTGGKYRVQKEDVENIEEKALSRAQQRFMGMVYAAKKGGTPASPEVAKAASGMSKKAAKDFAKTKHEGLPEKKEDTKEELSLVNKILSEFSPLSEGKLDDLLADIRGEDDEEKKSPKKSEKERKETAKKQVKRGKSDPSALTRRAAVAGASRIKAEREKTKRQRERQEYEKARREEKRAESREKQKEKQEKLESSMKEKRIKAAQAQSDREEAKKEKKKREVTGAVKSAFKGIRTGPVVSDKEKGSTGSSVDSAIETATSVGSAIGKATRGIVAAKMKQRKEKKQEEKRRERHEKIKNEMSKESFSNWREEFIFEVDDQSIKEPKEKIIDVTKKKNKIEINPNMSEGNIQEIAPLAGVLAKVAGGAAARGIASRGAGFAAKGALQKKVVDVAAQKGGEMTADMVQKRLEKKFKNEDEELEEGMTLKDFKANRKKLQRKEASVDAEKRGHVGKEWHNTGRKYSPDEAKSRRANMSDDDRAARHRSAIDPDDDRDENTYSADKTKNPKKLRKQKAMGESAAWTKKEGKSEAGGLNEKGRKSYERENPGSDLKAPSKEVGNPRRESFCSRMKGMKKKLTSKKTANDPDSRINKSLRAWNCN